MAFANYQGKVLKAFRKKEPFGYYRLEFSLHSCPTL